jgi:hypothetical protein
MTGAKNQEEVVIAISLSPGPAVLDFNFNHL